MKKTKTLELIFDKEIKQKDLTFFRSAILKMLGEPDVMFHNHIEDEKFVYKYPKIQYKVIGKKAALYCVDEGVEKIYPFISLQHKNVEIKGEKSDLLIQSVNAGNTLIQAWDTYRSYNITSWLPLNAKNYEVYKKLQTNEEKKFFLENVLRGNLLSLGKGLDIHFEKEIKVQIIDIIKEYTSDYKGIKMHTINADFKTNVSLPSHIGLGKGVSLGFGVVRRKRNE